MAVGNVQLATFEDYRGVEQKPFSEQDAWESVYAFLQQSTQKYSDKTALSFQMKSDKAAKVWQYTYREYMAEIHRIANVLQGLGVDTKTPVAMILPNIPEALFTMLATMSVGVYVPINPLLEPEQMASILAESEAKILVTLAPILKTDIPERTAKAVKLCPTIETVLEVDLAKYLPKPLAALMPLLRPKRSISHHAQILSLAKLMKQANPNALNQMPIYDAQHVCSLFHTGGTTGTPKLVQHTMKSILFQLWFPIHCIYQEGDVILCALPLFHVFGAYAMGLSAPGCGGELVMLTPAGFRGEGVIRNFWQITERYKASCLISVPTALSALNQVDIDADISSLRVTVCGSAAMPTQLFKAFEAKTGIRILEGYGQTEALCVCACNPPYGERRIGSVGFPIPYTKMVAVKINDEGTWQGECQSDEIGELVVQGDHVFNGYQTQSRNEAVFVTDDLGQKWLRTGDLGRQDAEGYFWITGRAKDLIIRGGHNIDPCVIEEAVMGHPAVALSAAIGQPDVHAGELPCLYVELKEGGEVDTETLRQFTGLHVNERTARPVYVEILPELPKTNVGKIFKPALRQRAIERVFTKALQAQGIESTIVVENDTVQGMLAVVKCDEDTSNAQIAAILDHFPIAWKRVS